MRRSEQGIALLAVMLVLSLLVILGTATLTLSHHAKIAATGEAEAEQGYYEGSGGGSGTDPAEQALLAAESGIDRALAKLRIDPLWPDGTNQYPKEMDGDDVEGPCGGGEIAEVKVNRTSVTAAGVDVTITSTGRCGSAVRKVQAEVTVSYDRFICGDGITNEGGVHIAGQGSVGLVIYSAPSSAYQAIIGPWGYRTNLVFGGGDSVSPVTLTLYRYRSSCGSTPQQVVYGNVYAAGSVDILSRDGGVVVTGNVYANGTISGQVYVNGNCQEGSGLSVPEFPAEIDPAKEQEFSEYYEQVAKSYGDDHYFDGDHEFTWGKLRVMDGVYFVNGQATLSGSFNERYTGRATIVAKSILIGSQHLRATSGNNVRGLISLNDMEVDGTWPRPWRHAVILCGGTLDLMGWNGIAGAVATRGITMDLEERCLQYFLYRETLFLLYPPGMPYVITEHSRQEV